WYPRMLAAYLRSMLTVPECELVRSQDRTGVSLNRIADRVTRDRLRAFAELLPRLAEASKYESYANFPALDRGLESLLEELPDAYVEKLHDYVLQDESPDDGPVEPRTPQDDADSARITADRLLQALAKPWVVYNEGLPDANRWTEPLLALLADKR